jgi:hypothetical protein
MTISQPDCQAILRPKVKPMFLPVPMIRLSMQWSRIAFEAQGIVALRLMGMSGITNAAPGENDRMIREKWLALWQSSLGAGLAMAQGANPVSIALAATAPVARKTRSNLRRLM